MDKWKDLELEKMKVGGNRNARIFLEEQADWDDSMPISRKYNTKAAALYRDKVRIIRMSSIISYNFGGTSILCYCQIEAFRLIFKASSASRT